MSKRMVVAIVILGVLLAASVPAALAQGPQEGIKVHGHWVIEVANPDGSVASHLEFENALMPGGARVLASLLSRNAAEVRGWEVQLVPSPGTAPFGSVTIDGNTTARNARIVEANFQYVGVPIGLSVTLVSAQAGDTVVLQGRTTAGAAGQISAVATQLTSASLTGWSQTSDFSGTSLPSLVTLAAGQIVQVTVTLSFS